MPSGSKSQEPGSSLRLSAVQAEILELLLEHGETYGLELVRQSNGSLKRGTIYVTLDRMEDRGFVRSRVEKKAADVPGIPRRLYQATGLGARAARARSLEKALMAGSLRRHR